ncbi:flavodoxin [Desulfosalsimonas propionicica]|uniref:Flavodoxin n=1 Tax=Desulfosalsimonas propionicica TaxID=332175 RepID=A0A7W0CCF6_9BACT|nr:flavodoxin family protein [Desulfosalsimonas propionicica]MBA2883193.1 flavodoxin [Desulfosalsimonas propionicica]
MKSMVVCSSRTGNTLKVAQAVYEVLPLPRALYPVDDAPDPDACDFIALGFWVDKGTADEKARRYLEKLKGKPIFLFGTLGAYPGSEHGKKCMENVKALAADNQILGTFLCQGRVDPEMIKWMEENLQDDPHHGMTPERRARLREAERHPNADDLAAAGNRLKETLNKMKKKRQGSHAQND